MDELHGVGRVGSVCLSHVVMMGAAAAGRPTQLVVPLDDWEDPTHHQPSDYVG